MIDVINKAVVMAPSMPLTAGQKTQRGRGIDSERDLKALVYVRTVIYPFTPLRQTSLIRLLFYTPRHLVKLYQDIIIFTAQLSQNTVTVMLSEIKSKHTG